MTRHRRRLIDRLAILLAAGVLIAAAVFLVNWWQASRRSSHVLEHEREYSEWKALTAKSLAQEHADAAGQFEECLKQTATTRRGCLTDQVTWYSRYAQRAVEQLKTIESHFAAQRDRPLSAQVGQRLRALEEFSGWLDSTPAEWTEEAGDAPRLSRVQALAGELRRAWQPAVHE